MTITSLMCMYRSGKLTGRHLNEFKSKQIWILQVRHINERKVTVTQKTEMATLIVATRMIFLIKINNIYYKYYCTNYNYSNYCCCIDYF